MAKKTRAVEFKDAADIARKMEVAIAAWSELPLMTGVNLRAVIPFAQALAVLAREIEDIKTRLPHEPTHKKNGKSKH